MKGQASMAVIVVAVFMLVGLVIFMLSATEPAGNAESRIEYRNLFATNMLLSIMNTETECGSFSEMLKAEHFGSGKCGESEFSERIGSRVDFILLYSGHTDYDWLIASRPESFTGTEEQWGNPDVVKTNGYWDATTKITSGGSRLEVKLYIRNK